MQYLMLNKQNYQIGGAIATAAQYNLKTAVKTDRWLSIVVLVRWRRCQQA